MEVNEENLPLPYTSEVDQVTGEYVLLLRLTPKGAYCIESIMEFIEELDLEKWLYGEEYPDDVDKKHYHFVIYTTLDIDKFRKKVRDFISPFYPNKTRGFGGAQYNLQYAENPRKALSYALKDLGATNFSGFTEECIECLRGESFQKLSFDAEVISLNKYYLNNDMEDYQFMARYFEIYSKFGRSINTNTIYGYLLSIKIKKFPEFSEIHARHFLNRFKD